MRRLPVLLLFLLSLCPWRALAQQIPGVQSGDSPDARVQWARYSRSLADSLVQDWVTLAARGDAESLSRFFTDGALLVAAGGEHAVGRDAIRALLQRAPTPEGPRVQLAGAVLGEGLMHTEGRVRFQSGGVTRTHSFSAVLESHHGRWQMRALAFAPAAPALAEAPMPKEALAPHARRVQAPQRTLFRLVVEPATARERQLAAGHEAPWAGYGVGIGLEMNRAWELRGHAWQQQNTMAPEPLVSYGVEARGYLFELWRLRPFVSIGAAYFQGTGAPDSTWVPAVGGGLAIRLLSHADLQVFVRDHLPATPDGVRDDFWLTEKRTQRPVVSAGLSLALGRRPGWRDSRPTAAQQAQQGASAGAVLNVWNRLEAALQQDDRAGAASAFGAGATLYAGGEAVHGAAAIFDALRDTGVQRVEPRAASVRGGVAYLESLLVTPAGERLLVTVLQRDREERWQIVAQMLR